MAEARNGKGAFVPVIDAAHDGIDRLINPRGRKPRRWKPRPVCRSPGAPSDAAQIDPPTP
jgi:hypothetical protein